MPVYVNDGLTETKPIKIFRINEAGELTAHLIFEFSVTFRPMRGLKAIAYQRDERLADGEKLEKMIRELILGYVVEINGVVSKLTNKPYEPKDVAKIIEVLDPVSLNEIVATLKSSAWDIEKMLGN